MDGLLSFLRIGTPQMHRKVAAGEISNLLTTDRKARRKWLFL